MQTRRRIQGDISAALQRRRRLRLLPDEMESAATRSRAQEPEEGPQMKNIVFSLYMIGSLCFFVGTALAWWTEAAAGRDAGQWEGAPDSEWYASLIQPDSGSSCCGEGDAWFADDTEVGPNGETIA